MPRVPPPDNARLPALTVVSAAGVLAAARFLTAARTYERGRSTGDWHQWPDASRGQAGSEDFR